MGIESLEGMTSGRYVVTTFSGTRHYVDLESKAVIRQGATGHEWGDTLLMVHPFAALAGVQPKVAVSCVQAVVPDGETFLYDTISGVHGGGRMRLDNQEEWRISSEIQTIEQWVLQDHPGGQTMGSEED